MKPVWPGPWRPIEGEGEAEFLETQLQRELVQSHPLFGLPVTPIARRNDLNDVLLELADGRAAVVHLTFASGPFTQLIPWSEAFDDIADFRHEVRDKFDHAETDRLELNLHHPANLQVLTTLSNGSQPAFALPEDVADRRDWDTGPLADLMHRVWYELGGRLPTDGRCLINNNPALVSPCGVILAMTQPYGYVLRVPPAVVGWATESAARICGERTREDQGELRSGFGDDWLVGAYLDHEIGWCRQIHRLYKH